MEKTTGVMIDLTSDDDESVETPVIAETKDPVNEPIINNNSIKGPVAEKSDDKFSNQAIISTNKPAEQLIESLQPSVASQTVASNATKLISNDPFQSTPGITKELTSVVHSNQNEPGASTTKVVGDPRQTSSNAACPLVNDIVQERVDSNRQIRRPSDEDDKRYAFSLVFNHSLTGTSAMQICRDASKEFVCFIC